jgi:hypothetical protein
MQNPFSTRYTCPVHRISDLHSRGYDHDFSLMAGLLFCAQLQKFCQCREFLLNEMHYVRRSAHNPFQFMVYGIEVPDWNVRGILLIKGKDHHGLFPEVALKKLQTVHPWRGNPARFL